MYIARFLQNLSRLGYKQLKLCIIPVGEQRFMDFCLLVIALKINLK